MKVEVSNAARVVFPAVGRTKGDVVAFYETIAPRALAHLAGRPLSIRRYPKGLAAPGFFQKNIPPHYPDTIARFAISRSEAATKLHPRKGSAAPPDVTVYPIVADADQLAYLANQGAIELHVPLGRAPEPSRLDRLVFDLDPPAGATDLVRRAALLVRDWLEGVGLATTLVATGSKGFHVVASVVPVLGCEVLAETTHKVATLLAAAHPDVLTNKFRIAQRGARVFVDWLRNRANATVIAPYSLRARPNASVAVPLAWTELETTAPDAFSIADARLLLDRPDPLATAAPNDGEAFRAAVDAAFERSGLTLEVFDRFRS